MLVLVILLLVMQGVAFVTLCERHCLGGSQVRVGPNKVSFIGLLQAVFDGLKLFKKEVVVGDKGAQFYFLVVPGVAFIISNTYWMVLPFYFSFFTFDYSIVFMMCLVGLFVYCVLMSGIVSKSKFGTLGGIRSSSQSVSYEVIFSLYLLSLLMQISSYYYDFFMNFYTLIFGLFYLFLVLAELNRAPFDFSEGESELVSGFNVEYSGVPFVFLFLSEYGSLLFFSVLFSVIFMGFSMLGVALFFCLILFVRSSFPRYRYDKMMSFFWFILLPLVLVFLFWSVVFWL
uniref:NADH-ubiquinone oxidoreductase chain 1 n=1 Tax=Philometroides sanguineus TaxID=378106 RepID=A0A0U1V608_9BILA|nr:NADH dehydrogenase subunit 1 [Philometroides sanguineus]AIN37104.1 NADH dehydrogenase subunit 1 [Philometroides sanguineus]